MVGEKLDETEVITRMMHVMYMMKLFDLKSVDWAKSFDDMGIDSLERIALITGFEHEFHTVFEDNVFDYFTNLNQIKQAIAQDHNSF